MALHTQSSFSSGEIDPALHERTNLQKFSSALATARNVLIGKTGRLISRPGRRNFIQCKEADAKVITHSMPAIGVILEWGDEYVRIYDTSGNLIDDIATDYGEDDLKYLGFQNIGEHLVLVTFAGDDAQLFLPLAELLFPTIYTGAEFKTTFTQLPTTPSFVSTTDTATGPNTTYCFTAVVNGEESAPYFDVTSADLPIIAGEGAVVIGRYTGAALEATYARHFFQFLGSTSLPTAVTEFRFYRRPEGGGSFGYVGSSVAYAVTAGSGYPSASYYINVTFTDHGQDADYTHQPPLAVGNIAVPGFSSIETTTVRAACTYQQRLILCLNDIVLASRVGFPFNFYRDFPYSADSALSFKLGVEGSRRILRAIESDGLAIFTTDGIYRHTGALSPDNLACPKLGEWIIDADVPPIAVPGGVLFIDSATNTVRQLTFSQERGRYTAEELSIFSNHLFAGNRVKSWTFEQGDTPVLWVVFADGTFASFTFEPDHEMKAWARHDSVYPVEHVHFMKSSPPNGIFSPLEIGQTLYVVNKDGQRYIEIGVPRYVSASIVEENPEADKNHSIAAIDGMATWEDLLNDDLEDPDEFVLEPVTPDDWEGQLTLTCGTSEIFKSVDLTQVGEPGPGNIGQVLRWFHPTEYWSMDLTIDEVTSENEVIVTPSEEFPEAYAEGLRLYLTTNILRPQYRYNLDEQIAGGATGFTCEAFPVDTINWNTPLTLSATDPIFTDPGPGTVGTVLAHDSTDFGYNILLQVIEWVNDTQVIVQPVGFMTDDLAESNAMELWTTVEIQTYSLDHLEDEDVSIVSDGAVLASPNNNIENYGENIVTDGLLAIPNNDRGAIIHVGRPYVMDVETLDIDTVEQRPILLESESVNKLYIKVLNSRGLYAADTFPADDTVTGLLASGIEEVRMTDTDTIPVDHTAEADLPGNRYDRPRSVRREISLKGRWSTNGRVALRQVDPIHFEILSIIPDIEGLRRGP